MARYLVIVESPTKVKTIKKFLGSNYVVMASNGHVRDLPKSQMGVDLEHDFEPKYITIRGKGEILAGLRKEVKKADKIYLASVVIFLYIFSFSLSRSESIQSIRLIPNVIVLTSRFSSSIIWFVSTTS